MKRSFMLILIFLLFFTFGCTSAPISNVNQEPVEHGIYPEEIMQSLEVLKLITAGEAIHVEGKTFLIASFGPRSGTGYHAQITDTYEENGKLMIETQLEIPKETSTAEITSYPYAVEVIDGIYNEVEFITKEGLLPKIIGYDGQLREPFTVSRNMIIFDFAYDPLLLQLSGIARVFEGNIQYELISTDGEILESSYIQARSGGFDWGFFYLDLPIDKSNIDSLILFTESAEDGSRENEIFLPLKDLS